MTLPFMKDFDGDGVAETLRYEYKIIDVNHPEDGPKPWDVSKMWSETIDYLLKQGHRILKVERVGTGMKTKYYFSPVVGQVNDTVAGANAAPGQRKYQGIHNSASTRAISDMPFSPGFHTQACI